MAGERADVAKRMWKWKAFLRSKTRTRASGRFVDWCRVNSDALVVEVDPRELREGDRFVRDQSVGILTASDHQIPQCLEVAGAQRLVVPVHEVPKHVAVGEAKEQKDTE